MMDVVEIQKYLPHRYPLLLVDRVIEIDPRVKLVAYKNVTANEPFFVGHFPGKPVMPGVLILEALAQAAGILAFKSTNLDPERWIVVLMAIDGAKFRKPVVPGDRLTLTIEVLRDRPNVWKQRGTASVDGQVVAEAEFLATVVERSSQDPHAPGAAS